MSLAEPVTSSLRDAGLDPLYVEDLVRATLEEDLAGGADVTSEATISPQQWARATLSAQSAGVIAGLPVVEATFEASGDGMEIQRRMAEGSWVEPGTPLLTVVGPTRQILLAERTALNLGSRLSGIATATNQWVHAVSGTGATIRDTRKTTPLLRPLEKYAVRVGGGENHRSSLSDMALIKDNHVAAAGGITAALQAVRAAAPDVPVEVEVDDVAGAVEAVEAGAELILLDNFSVDQTREAVAAVGGRAQLEVSGGLNIQDARAYGESGVNYISVGGLTHSARALDVSLEIEQVGFTEPEANTANSWFTPAASDAGVPGRDTSENSIVT
ncbi:carboxylating nicotinate-nucleotide diphosphorylase [Actinobacteria bacterium YIM 96077]|uniref:Nicotinate-nucleotide pyrophosphorylase [carboxylating] n=1 Tax=Phytoactinopolyspora halophila TaxID=1981511 RepID=A0A329R0I9_9ACTN|nr:carboxylating nicotinate-nucleotide diphosphorylase [Phytoactinopolyspora halophila]AYY11480.1 carboxylating nicotinate-nucleotide diphosphorylase [Actinobacteria bacterium YIM 96077]RAW18037.1 carboxylating nicotinate-nucleotide diphosphorylase [Phytoactinopolyspora halophila]